MDVSFTLERGSLTVVTGRIGAGKSTLLHVLLGLLRREDGEIRWNGQPVQTRHLLGTHRRVPIHPRHRGSSVKPCGRTFCSAGLRGRRSLKRATHAAVLESDVTALENRLDTAIGHRGVKLSGGQVQRAATARMFVRDAELLVFDDSHRLSTRRRRRSCGPAVCTDPPADLSRGFTPAGCAPPSQPGAHHGRW